MRNCWLSDVIIVCSDYFFSPNKDTIISKEDKSLLFGTTRVWMVLFSLKQTNHNLSKLLQLFSSRIRPSPHPSLPLAISSYILAFIIRSVIIPWPFSAVSSHFISQSLRSISPIYCSIPFLSVSVSLSICLFSFTSSLHSSTHFIHL